MKKLLFAYILLLVFAACSDRSQSTVNSQRDSSSTAPETNPDMSATQSMVNDSTINDSTGTDSSHLRPDAPK